jgi:DNA-binding transcriptional LysR family regulator
MDLRQLAALTAVAECGTFSAAADRLNTVQSNVSAHIARLEKILDATLVDRTAGRLTEEGEIVVARARRVQSELDGLIADVTALRHDVVGDVKVGVIGTVARWLVPPLHSAMAKAHPHVRMIVVDASTTSLAPQLVGGTLALAVVNLPLVDPDVTVMPLFSEEMVAVIPEGHKLFSLERLHMDNLHNVPLLLPPTGTSYRHELDEAADVADVSLVPQAEIDGVRLITSMAFDGVGVAVVPATAVPRHLSGPWKALALEGIAPRHVGIVQRRRGMLSAPARALLGVMLTVIQEQVALQAGVTLIEEQGPLLDAEGNSIEAVRTEPLVGSDPFKNTTATATFTTGSLLSGSLPSGPRSADAIVQSGD